MPPSVASYSTDSSPVEGSKEPFTGTVQLCPTEVCCVQQEEMRMLARKGHVGEIGKQMRDTIKRGGVLPRATRQVFPWPPAQLLPCRPFQTCQPAVSSRRSNCHALLPPFHPLHPAISTHPKTSPKLVLSRTPKQVPNKHCQLP